MKILSSLLTLTTCAIMVAGRAHAAGFGDAGIAGAAGSDWIGAALGLPLVFGICLVSSRRLRG
ncbi:MAG TPA: hypothetical protein VG248_00775 [Caulobacteraceae bacterium]|jgi:hypothetical protein|nr:hypothetical protein [Caulobacteraceae bacterium]